MRNDCTYDHMIDRAEAQARARRSKKRAIVGTAAITTLCSGLWQAALILFGLLAIANVVQKRS